MRGSRVALKVDLRQRSPAAAEAGRDAALRRRGALRGCRRPGRAEPGGRIDTGGMHAGSCEFA